MQTVNEARYTFWHTVIDLWQASDKPKDEWCWENKLPLKTFVHYEGIFRRQKARGYVYGKMNRMDSNKEPLEQGRTDVPIDNGYVLSEGFTYPHLFSKTRMGNGSFKKRCA